MAFSIPSLPSKKRKNPIIIEKTGSNSENEIDACKAKVASKLKPESNPPHLDSGGKSTRKAHFSPPRESNTAHNQSRIQVIE